jgi:hypothetical protein
MIPEQQAVRRQRIDVGGSNVRMAEHRETVAAPLVGADEQHVGTGHREFLMGAEIQGWPATILSVLTRSLRTALRAASGRCNLILRSIASCSFCA